jgi:DNA-binding CsgD family transcriptional regulator
MRRPNHKQQTLERMESKTLEAQFLHEVQYGMSCSRFEAEGILDVVKDIYFPFMDAAGGKAPPGRITLMAVDADEPAGKALADCRKRAICLTVHRGIEDDKLLQRFGPAGFRQGRILDLCQEALSQGALLTREDLALRIFFVSPRTITRDLKVLRDGLAGVMIPLRSTVHDLGPVLTHRSEIVRLALVGKTTSQICRILHHSPAAVANYLSTFVRCVHLARRQMQVGQIAFLLRRGVSLIGKYLDLLAACEADANMAYHLDELMRLGRCGGKKQRPRRRGSDG